MPDPKKPNPDSEPAPADPAPRTPWWRRRSIMLLVVGGVGLHAIGYSWYAYRLQPAATAKSPEIDLGAYHFIAPPSEEGAIERADFRLHIALLKEVQTSARALIEEHRFRLEQNVEELLRRAHGGDFDDPTLTELKRQVQETINKTVGHRVIEEVIITKLMLQRRDAIEPPNRRRDPGVPSGTASSNGPDRPVGNPGDTAWLRGDTQE